MTTRMPTLCASCAHFDKGKCSAFPDGIPDDIAVFGGDHRSVLPNQTGAAVYSMQDGQEQDYEDWAFTYVLSAD